jgi:hypothetical protein
VAKPREVCMVALEWMKTHRNPSLVNLYAEYVDTKDKLELLTKQVPPSDEARGRDGNSKDNLLFIEDLFDRQTIFLGRCSSSRMLGEKGLRQNYR